MEHISAQDPALEPARWLSQGPWELARYELEQAAETGRDVSALHERFLRLDPDDSAGLLGLMELYQEILAAPGPATWPYFEESGLEEIADALPDEHYAEAVAPDRLADRMRGAWFGRIIGNMVGKPVEVGPTRAAIREYLSGLDAYPITDYLPFPDGVDRSGLGLLLPEEWNAGATRGRVDGSVRDDDIDYTIFGLHLLETYGARYNTSDVAREWLSRFPVHQLFTAERAAYRNLVREVPLLRAGEHRNPYREWIGALIRADVFGYTAPGDSRRAALLAYEDARLSHRANGIYGAMWAAALVSAAFTAATPEESVEISLENIPARSRLATEIATVLGDFRAGLSWDEAVDRLEERWPRMHWAHAINNAGALTAAVLWGRGEFTNTVGLAVQAGLDTDSIGATTGSWAGAYQGYEALPAHFVEPLHDLSRSAVFGFGEAAISSYADRTLKLIDRLAEE
jgi:ADP-ribosylglycohydrolase